MQNLEAIGQAEVVENFVTRMGNFCGQTNKQTNKQKETKRS
jgi:hypothetical protein